MKINEELQPKSSFLSIEKDLNTIINIFMNNDRLKKLLYYNVPEPLEQPKLSKEQSYEMLGKNIKIIPKIEIDPEVNNYIVIAFDNFTENETNPEFRDNTIEFDIICHFDNWQLKDFQLRPFRIAAEIDSIISQKRLSGIGKVQFLGAKKIPITENLGGICLMYEVIHGEEDKINMPNPADEEQFLKDFEDMLKSGKF